MSGIGGRRRVVDYYPQGPARQEDAVSTVSCPRCMATPAEYCKGRKGQERRNHQERMVVYNTWRRECVAQNDRMFRESRSPDAGDDSGAKPGRQLGGAEEQPLPSRLQVSAR
jgi:hypothetical protein